MCAVFGCSGNFMRDGLSYFRIPKVGINTEDEIHELLKKRRAAWISAINRADFTEKKINTQRVCQRHFIAGKPSALRDTTNPDWAPSQNMGYTKGVFIRKKADLDRHARATGRKRPDFQWPAVINKVKVNAEEDKYELPGNITTIKIVTGDGVTSTMKDNEGSKNEGVSQRHIENVPKTTIASLSTSGYTCRTCNERFLYFREWTKHKKSHYNTLKKCKLCDTVCVSLTALNHHRRLAHSTRSFQCNICHSDFTEKSQRDEHVKKHPGQECTICHRVLEPHKSMQNHIAAHMRQGRCFVCKEFFPSKSDLDTHLQLLHEICCKKCGRKFYKEEDHRRHVGEKRRKNRCDFCCRGFRSWQELRSHVKSHFQLPEKRRCTRTQTTRSQPAELDASSSDVTSSIKVEIPDGENSELIKEEKLSPVEIKTEIVKEEPDEGFWSQSVERDGMNFDAADTAWKDEVNVHFRHFWSTTDHTYSFNPYRGSSPKENVV